MCSTSFSTLVCSSNAIDLVQWHSEPRTPNRSLNCLNFIHSFLSINDDLDNLEFYIAFMRIQILREWSRYYFVFDIFHPIIQPVITKGTFCYVNDFYIVQRFFNAVDPKISIKIIVYSKRRATAKWRRHTHSVQEKEEEHHQYFVGDFFVLLFELHNCCMHNADWKEPVFIVAVIGPVLADYWILWCSFLFWYSNRCTMFDLWFDFRLRGLAIVRRAFASMHCIYKENCMAFGSSVCGFHLCEVHLALNTSRKKR